MLLGGGGTTNPRMEIILQVTVAVIFLLACILPGHGAGRSNVPAIALLMAIPVALLPLLQLIPLPPEIWRSLPGREVERAALDLVGSGAHWMPLSIVPVATFASLLAVICPVAIMIYVARLDWRDRTAIVFVIVAMALASIALGVLQVAHVGGATWVLYKLSTYGWLVGFQANRNAQADVLLIAMLASATLSLVRFRHGDAGRLGLSITFSCLLVLSVGTIMTGSRTGIALLPVTMAFVLTILWPRLNRKVTHLRYWAVGSSVAIVAVIYGLTRISAIQNVIARFGTGSEGRWDFWLDTIYAVRRSWPFGTGIGTFSYAFEAAERLEMVNSLFPTRAHNDWLEWTLETGVAGWVAVIVTLAAIVWSARLAWRQIDKEHPNSLHRGQILFGVGVLVIVSLHALVDYPTRSMSLAALIAVGAACLTPLARKGDLAALPDQDSIEKSELS